MIEKFTWRGKSGPGEPFQWGKKPEQPKTEGTEEPAKPEQGPDVSKRGPEEVAARRLREHIEDQIRRVDRQIETAKANGAEHLIEQLQRHRDEWTDQLNIEKDS